MNRPVLILSLLVVFLLGAAGGLIGSVVIARQMFGSVPAFFGGRSMHGPGGHGEGPGSHHDRFARLAHDLELTPEQIERLEPRVDATRKQFDALRDSMRAQIDRELTPEQREKFKRLQAQRQFPRPGND